MGTWVLVRKTIHASEVDVFTLGLYIGSEATTKNPETVKPQQVNSQRQYHVHHEGQPQGPFDLQFIEAMVLAGVYPPSVVVQKTGSVERVPLNELQKLVQPSRFEDVIHVSLHPKLEVPTELPIIDYIPGKSITEKKSANTPISEAMLAWGMIVVAGIIFFGWAYTQVSATNPARASSPSVFNSAGISDRSPKKVEADHELKVGSALTPSKMAAPVRSSRDIPLPVLQTPSRTSLIEDFQTYRDASGRTYRVPNSAYSRLISMKSAMERKKRDMDSEEAQLKSLSDQLDRDGLILDRTSQHSVDGFNRRVEQLNSANDRLQSMVDDYNRDVNAFNAELERVGTPIR
jgi:hypothetical protein